MLATQLWMTNEVVSPQNVQRILRDGAGRPAGAEQGAAQRGYVAPFYGELVDASQFDFDTYRFLRSRDERRMNAWLSRTDHSEAMTEPKHRAA
jgi:hypothetical protein